MEHQHNHDNQPSGAIYTCPMHPEIKQDKPGNCPKCGMNLIPVKKAAEKSASTDQRDDNNPAMGHAGHKHNKW